jgi:hypothetical protein
MGCVTPLGELSGQPTVGDAFAAEIAECAALCGPSEPLRNARQAFLGRHVHGRRRDRRQVGHSDRQPDPQGQGAGAVGQVRGAGASLAANCPFPPVIGGSVPESFFTKPPNVAQ